MCQTARHGTKLRPSTARLVPFLPHLQAHVASSTGLVGPCICGLFCLHRPLWPPSLTALTPVTELPQNKTSHLSEFPFYSSSSLAVLRTQYVHIRHKMEHIYLHCACGCFRGYVHTHTYGTVSRHKVVLFVLALHFARYRNPLAYTMK